MAIQECAENNTNYVLKLREIASWQVKGVEDNRQPSIIQARVPSLQRGAVWEPQQIELLWDSIFRGFPIGSIVVINRIDGQRDKNKPTHAKTENAHKSEANTTHHILDGQQRCNAIAWGFVDPWKKEMSDDVVLWLDLRPGDLLKTTTRKYLFRITTKAHPWGFHHGDGADTLRTEQRGKFSEKLAHLYESEILPPKFHEKLNAWDVTKRPLPGLSLPYDANFPVPLFLIFRHFREGKVDWNALAQEEWAIVSEIWSGNRILDLEKERQEEIELGLKMAEQSRLVALLVPNTLKGIDNIEKIFQRLNSQGTPLDNEELVYSMIKAYWPEIEDVISKLDRLPITEVRLVNLGVRIALTLDGSEKLAPDLTVDGIRKIFSPNINKSEKDAKDEHSIRNFFEIDNGLVKALEWIDKSFLYEKKSRPYGLPSYLRSSIAWSSRDVFAWLMLLAKRYEYIPIVDSKKIIGLALSIHWFGVDKAKAVDKLIGKADISSITVSNINEGNEKKLVLAPLNETDLDAAFQLDDCSEHEQLSRWTSFWQGVVVHDKNGTPLQEKEAIERREKYGLFVEKLRGLNELLVYKQRAYIESVFDGFDPSNKLMWKGHNRPWDYDHILPTNKLNGQGRGVKEYTAASQAWQQSIANLVAIDFSFNRKSQDIAIASDKYPSDKNINDGAFDIDLEHTKDLNVSRKFIIAAKNRLIEIYHDWHHGLEVI